MHKLVPRVSADAQAYARARAYARPLTRVVLLCHAGLLSHVGLASASEVNVSDLQASMLVEIERDVRETRNYTGRDKLSARVLEAMATVPRHEFVDRHDPDVAYINRPLPIGHGQTISQPFIVALMTELMEIEPDHRVLEIGTGTDGYQIYLALISMEGTYI